MNTSHDLSANYVNWDVEVKDGKLNINPMLSFKKKMQEDILQIFDYVPLTTQALKMYLVMADQPWKSGTLLKLFTT